MVLGMTTCFYCGKIFKQRDYRHVYCTQDCRLDFNKEKKYQEKRRKNVPDFSRKFSDMTITMIADSIIKGESFDVIIRLCCWDEDRFYQQLSKNKARINNRVSFIKKRQALGTAGHAVSGI